MHHYIQHDGALYSQEVTYQFGISVFTSKYSKTERRSSAHMVSMLTKRKNLYLILVISWFKPKLMPINAALPLKTKVSSSS